MDVDTRSLPRLLTNHDAMLSDAESRAYEDWEDAIKSDLVVSRIHDSKAVDNDTTVFVGEQVVLDDLRAKFPNFPMPFNKLTRKTTIIAKAPGMGLGMFATRKLRVGETVVRERPLLFAPSLVGDDRLRIPIQNAARPWRVQRAFNNHVLGPAKDGMSASNREVYSKLSNTYHMSPPPEVLDVYPDVAVFAANSFNVEKPMAGRYKEYRVVARDASRINHSCSPNAICEFDESTFTFTVKISRDIRKAEQIFVSYCSLEYPRLIRQAILSMYNITPCTCCRLNEAESDARRGLLGAFSGNPVRSMYRTLAGIPRHRALSFLLRLKEDIETEGLELMLFYPIVLYTIGHFQRDIGQEHKAREAERKADIYFDLIGDALTAASFKNWVVFETLIYDSPSCHLFFTLLNFLPRLTILLAVFIAMIFYVVHKPTTSL